MRGTRSLVEQLWASGEGVVSTQVLQELCLNLRRKVLHPLPIGEVRQLIRDYSSWEVIINTAESVIEALDIESRYKLSLRDALIICAAETAGASILYSEGLGTGQRYRGIQVVNPLLSSKAR